MLASRAEARVEGAGDGDGGAPEAKGKAGRGGGLGSADALFGDEKEEAAVGATPIERSSFRMRGRNTKIPAVQAASIKTLKPMAKNAQPRPFKRCGSRAISRSESHASSTPSALPMGPKRAVGKAKSALSGTRLASGSGFGNKNGS